MFCRDRMSEECGVYGYFSKDEKLNVATSIYYGLFALQHRGQESSGIAMQSNGELVLTKKMGLISQGFSPVDLNTLTGRIGIGHVRYSTAGKSNIIDAQPLYAEIFKPYTDFISLAHNGNISNADKLRQELKSEGHTFQTRADSEVILKLVSKEKSGDLITNLSNALARLKGAFSIVLLTRDKLIAARDPHGVRPLVLGQKDEDWVVSSETCALDIIQADFIREIEPGEIAVMDENGLKSAHLEQVDSYRQCVFELIYFSRPDSFHFGTNVHMSRESMGRALANQENGFTADYVIAVPDSGVPASLGYSKQSRIPYDRGFTRNHYIGRSFIHPRQQEREMAVKVKLNPVFPVVHGNELIVIDDSLVRGTTCKKIVKLLKDFGAEKVHLRFASPPVKYPCVYGIDTPDRKKLLAANHDLEGIREFVGADSVMYLSMESLKSCLKEPENFCYACFTGEYFDR